MKNTLVCIMAALLACTIALAEKPTEKANPKFSSVRKIFIDPIDGNGGTLARNQLIALLANSERFEVVEDLKLADAVLKGVAETQDAGVSVTEKGKGLNIIKGFYDSGSNSSATRIVKSTLIIRLTLSTGEVVWAWDDTKQCRKDSKPQCAIEELLKKAKE
jgi:hypothetical protein